jgi:hypothetical protein
MCPLRDRISRLLFRADPPAPMSPMALDANPAFEVATIKPNPIGGSGNRFGMRGRTFSTTNTSLEDLIVFAYDMHAKSNSRPQFLDEGQTRKQPPVAPMDGTSKEVTTTVLRRHSPFLDCAF